jgi:TDG/mug DNA glycosylase family protein
MGAGPVLPDVLAPGLRVVFCGTAPGTQSAAARAYYAGRGNKFWPTLARVGLTPRQLLPAEYAEVLAFGIGLTDLAKKVSGPDSALKKSDFGVVDLQRKLLTFQPGILAFTSKRAAREYFGKQTGYGLQEEGIGRSRVFVLPSPSGLASGHWDMSVWRDLAEMLRAPL